MQGMTQRMLTLEAKIIRQTCLRSILAIQIYKKAGSSI